MYLGNTPRHHEDLVAFRPRANVLLMGSSRAALSFNSAESPWLCQSNAHASRMRQLRPSDAWIWNSFERVGSQHSLSAQGYQRQIRHISESRYGTQPRPVSQDESQASSLQRTITACVSICCHFEAIAVGKGAKDERLRLHGSHDGMPSTWQAQMGSGMDAEKGKIETLTAGFEPTRAMPK